MNLLLMIFAAVIVAVILSIVVVKFVPLKMRWLVSLLLLGAAIFLVVKIYEGIMDPIKFDKEKQVRYAKVIKKLKLIRDAEVKYEEAKGTYAKSKEALLNFIENDSLVLTETRNIEEKRHTGGGIYKTIAVKKVDTVGYEKAIKYFKNVDYKNMFKVPDTNEEFSLETSSIEKVAGLMVPVFEAKVDKKIILKGMNKNLIKKELEAVETDQIKGPFVKVGSLEEVTVGGNWPPFYDNDEDKKKE